MKRADSSWNGHSTLTAMDQLFSSALLWEAGCPSGQEPHVLPKLHTVAISPRSFTMLLLNSDSPPKEPLSLRAGDTTPLLTSLPP